MRRVHRFLAVFALTGLLASAGQAEAESTNGRISLGEAPLAESPAVAIPTASPSDVPTPASIEARLSDLVRRPVEPAARVSRTKLSAVLSEVTARGITGGAAIGVHVRDLDSGAILYDRRGDRALNPASNHKLLVAIAALELLGPDYRFETRLARAGNTLYVRGEGDPSLMEADLYALLAQATHRGELEGIERVVLDDTAFSETRYGPGYTPDGAGHCYLAPSGALSIERNTVEVIVTPTAAGQPVRVRTQPEIPGLTIEAKATTGAGELRIDTHATADGTTLTVHGHLRSGADPVHARRRVHDPAAAVGPVVTRMLEELTGRTLDTAVRGETPSPARTLAVHRSAPLRDVLGSAMKYSNNFTTEQVLRTLAWRGTGNPGNWVDGTALLRKFRDAIGSHDEYAFVNASGLNRHGRATPRALVDLLALTAREGTGAAAVIPILPGAGEEGTLRYRMPHAAGRVRAKTGTMAGVTALSGVATSKDGVRNIGFSVIVNGGPTAEGRALQDEIAERIVRHLDRSAAG